jgi:hypothetical protein
MNQTEKDRLYAFFYETVVLAYDAYKTLRREPKAGTRNDLKSALAAATGVSFQGAFAESSQKEPQRDRVHLSGLWSFRRCGKRLEA